MIIMSPDVVSVVMLWLVVHMGNIVRVSPSMVVVVVVDIMVVVVVVDIMVVVVVVDIMVVIVVYVLMHNGWMVGEIMVPVGV